MDVVPLPAPKSGSQPEVTRRNNKFVKVLFPPAVQLKSDKERGMSTNQTEDTSSLHCLCKADMDRIKSNSRQDRIIRAQNGTQYLPSTTPAPLSTTFFSVTQTQRAKVPHGNTDKRDGPDDVCEKPVHISEPAEESARPNSDNTLRPWKGSCTSLACQRFQMRATKWKT